MANTKTTTAKKTTPAARTKAAKKRMLTALAKSHAIVSTACEAADVSRTQHYEWLKVDPAYNQAVDDVDEGAIDFVEGQLLKRIEGYEHKETKVFVYDGVVTKVEITKHYPPDTPAMSLYLKARAKQRGYFDKVEQDVKFAGDTDLTLNIGE